MVNICHHKATGDGPGEPAAALFQQQWQLYRNFVDNNYFYHREVYCQLHRILVEEAIEPRRRRARRLAASLGAPEPGFVDGIDTRGI
jgi:hypothetical protein